MTEDQWKRFFDYLDSMKTYNDPRDTYEIGYNDAVLDVRKGLRIAAQKSQFQKC